MAEVPCRVRVKKFDGRRDVVVDLKDYPDARLETRFLWVSEVAKPFSSPPSVHNTIRPWDFILTSDGSVEPQSAALAGCEGNGLDKSMAYPPRFRIPPDTLLELGQEEAVKRAEMFALGSLAYEIMSGQKPFEELTDEEIQLRFGRNEFPENLRSVPLWQFILSCWSQEFSNDVGRIIKDPKEDTQSKALKIFRAADTYVKGHPVRFTLQVIGVTAAIASMVALPILGAVGFTAAGPAAGSAAAAWQSSLVAVEAGSLFAWCQSAAMGGAALSGVVATGVAGTGVAGAATVPLIPRLVKKIKATFSRSDPPSL